MAAAEKGHGKAEGGEVPLPFSLPLDPPPFWTPVRGGKPDTYNHGQKSLGQYCNIHIFVISRFPLKTVQPFGKFLAVLPHPTLYKLETRKKFWIHVSNIVCGVRGGAGTV